MVIGVLLLLAALTQTANLPPTSQQTTGAQSPIVNAKGDVLLTYQSIDTTNVLNVLTQNSANIVRQTVEEVLSQMDTNRERVEILTKEVEKLQALGHAREQELDVTKAQLTNALTTISSLQSRLESTIQLSMLTPADQKRVQETVKAVEKAKSVSHIGTLNIRGALIIGSPPPK